MIEPHERKVTGLDWSKPSTNPGGLRYRIPGWDEIPEEFRFVDGFPVLEESEAKEGIDTEAAKKHVRYIAESWEYAVEHKHAALRWLQSLWFINTHSHD